MGCMHLVPTSFHQACEASHVGSWKTEKILFCAGNATRYLLLGTEDRGVRSRSQSTVSVSVYGANDSRNYGLRDYPITSYDHIRTLNAHLVVPRFNLLRTSSEL